MTRNRAVRFALGAAGVAGAAGLSALAGSMAAGVAASGWGLAGWLAAAVPGLVGGAWIASRFGSPGAAFLGGVGVTMAVRAVAVVAGLAMALRSGGQAPWLFLGAFAACFVPLAVFEAVWFVREGRTRDGGAARG